MGNGSFGPNASLTRGDFLVMPGPGPLAKPHSFLQVTPSRESAYLRKWNDDSTMG